ncbi:MAG: SpoIIIAH-like family protein [Oscillospiraceae bacterium]
MKANLIKKQVTVFTLMLALALAVYLNWRFAKTENDSLLVTQTLSGKTQTEDAAATGAEPELSSPTEGESAIDTEKYYGEALFVSTDESAASDYFAKSRTMRSQTRDEALDTLQKSLQKTDLTEAQKNELTAQLLGESKAIAIEGTLESLIKAKGFRECVAFASGERVKIIVQSGADGLSAAQVSQIKEIVLSECTVKAQNVSVVEIK